MKETKQQKFWQSNFGKEYTDRSQFSHEELDKFYEDKYGISLTAMNDNFLKGLSIENILEVGCNLGNMLNKLQAQGYKNLYGIEVQEYAVEKSKQLTKNINIIQGSALELPFKDDYFDLVFTCGVLIHIKPDDIVSVMMEIHRVSKKYILGFEYFSEEYQEIEYRGNKDALWKANFAKIYLDNFPDLELVKKEKYKYLENENIDMMFLLRKK